MHSEEPWNKPKYKSIDDSNNNEKKWETNNDSLANARDESRYDRK